MSGRQRNTNRRGVSTMLLATVGLFLLSACDRKAGAADAPPPPSSESARAEKGPAMWAVTDADSTIYLFGTFHILPAGTKWTTPAFDTAMKETPVTLTEVDTTSEEAQRTLSALVTELGFNPPGVTLTGLLGPVRAVRFSAVASRYGLSMSAFEPMKPWLAMISLSVAIMQNEGFDAKNGAEETVLANAEAEGDRIAHLESAEFQIRALASLDEAEILADFDTSLAEYEDFDGYAARVLNAWTTGDIKALEKETLKEMRETSPDSYRILIKDRNENWVKEITGMMAGDEDYFIAVGAAHLIGDGGVVDMLRKRGFAVQRVQ
ncbi:MAG: TraB/GumN family protein [Pseudomonadota bacterium]